MRKIGDSVVPSPGNIKEELAPKVLEFMPQITVMQVVTLTILSLIAMIAVLLIRKALINRQLNHRVSALHLPVSTFEASDEEVRRAARRLTRTRPALWAAAPGPGAAIRVRLATRDDGLLEYRLEGPQSARSIIEGRLYDHVEVIPEKAVGGESGVEENSPGVARKKSGGENSPGV
ncbi:hypothetical protein [Nocardiopsis sp. FR6]|uniref:hypothetical protein n=1 Tax=Nocardiopsis sp. FR6 TaxID=2605986 RepID=UPI00135BC2EB|nr:hypothetical protein [Nocardiopsis sp. FR6]